MFKKFETMPQPKAKTKEVIPERDRLAVARQYLENVQKRLESLRKKGADISASFCDVLTKEKKLAEVEKMIVSTEAQLTGAREEIELLTSRKL